MVQVDLPFNEATKLLSPSPTLSFLSSCYNQVPSGITVLSQPLIRPVGDLQDLRDWGSLLLINGDI